MLHGIDLGLQDRAIKDKHAVGRSCDAKCTSFYRMLVNQFR